MSLSGIQESTRPFPHIIYTSSLNTQEEMVGLLLQDYFYVQLVNMACGSFLCSVHNVCNYWIQVEFFLSIAGSEAMFADLGQFTAGSIKV